MPDKADQAPMTLSATPDMGTDEGAVRSLDNETLAHERQGSRNRRTGSLDSDKESARMDTTVAQDPASAKTVFAAGRIPPASQRKPLDINDVVAMLTAERKQNRKLTQRLYELTDALRECAQFLGDFQSDDVERPKWAAEALEVRLRKVLEAE